MKNGCASQATELQSLRAAVGVLVRREALRYENEETAARNALTQQAAAERIVPVNKRPLIESPSSFVMTPWRKHNAK